MRHYFYYLLFIFISFSNLNFAQDKPNVIFILADDLGYGDLSYLNANSKIYTPHIDQLAREGKSFKDAHAPASLCTPTRYAILTGRYGWRSSLKKGPTIPKWIISTIDMRCGTSRRTRGNSGRTIRSRCTRSGMCLFTNSIGSIM